MADYIYTMETRLTPDQMRALTAIQEAARAHELNLYVTGGTIRDIISGFNIRDLDLTVQGNALKLQKDLEKAAGVVHVADEETKSLYVSFPGGVRAEVTMAHSATYEKTGRPPHIAPATITEDLRHRDFTVNAMALSLNEGSRGLLLDPFNGMADIEGKLLRVIQPYVFVEDPSRLIRAARLAARFHWIMEERTQMRYDNAKEGDYMQYITKEAVGAEIEALAFEDDPLHVMKTLEKEGWLKVLHPHWSVAKVDTPGLSQLLKTRQQMMGLGYPPDPSVAVLYFITSRMNSKEVADLQKLMPHKDLVQAWRHIEDHAKELAKRLSGKEAATPSKTWTLLSGAKAEDILFLEVTARQQSVAQKIRNFFGKWRQLKDRLPFPEMAELLITPQLPEYPRIAEEAFMLLLDGKLRSHNEIMKFLKPYAPPPPPPPPPPRRGRAAKAAAPATAAVAAEGKKGKGKAPVQPPPAPKPEEKAAKPVAKAAAKPAPKPAKPAKKPATKAPHKKAK